MKQADNLYELRKDILEDLEKDGYRYIARDKNGALYAYSDKPIKLEKSWFLSSVDGALRNISSMPRAFTDIEWKDKEPFRIPWANWKDVPVDTKVIVTGVDGSEWKCHFCKKVNDNAILVFRDGKTSWTTDDVIEVDIDRVRLA